MWRILQADKPDDFVLATNETHTVREFVEKAFKTVGTTIKWVGEGVDEKGVDEKDPSRVLVAIDPAYFRPTEVDLLLGDAAKAKRWVGLWGEGGARRSPGMSPPLVPFADAPAGSSAGRRRSSSRTSSRRWSSPTSPSSTRATSRPEGAHRTVSCGGVLRPPAAPGFPRAAQGPTGACNATPSSLVGTMHT